MIPNYKKLKPKAVVETIGTLTLVKSLDLVPNWVARRTSISLEVADLDASEVLVTVSENNPDHIGLWFAEADPDGQPTGNMEGQVLTKEGVVMLINRLHLAMGLLASATFTGRMDIRAGYANGYTCDPAIPSACQQADLEELLNV